MYLVILNRTQITRTTPELALPLQNSVPHQKHPRPSLCTLRPTGGSVDEGTTPARGRLSPYVSTGPIHDRSSVESGIQLGTLQLRGRQLTFRPPRPHFPFEELHLSFA
ncbi:hypothetical protein AVEN_250802-1 [Araneus ventricosus]|uniref:Uncharacterized protein n=1 Tax=Araneus ventricosus TaxID=182803 RepID=A0A4Y2UHK3_ARAVE|nr:hypothetical protein AVEN_250802-1 [Araneus ventricosus]